MATGSVTLHSSWRGIVTSALGALLLLIAGIIVVGGSGWRFLPTLTLVAGVVLSLVVLLDYPIATSFDAQGVTRRMVLRRHHMSWGRLDQLSRARPGVVAGLRKLGHGGLVGVVGRRRYLLTDRCESSDEFLVLERLLDEVDPRLLEQVPRPRPGTTPTWLYRRARWAPDRGGDR